MAIYTTHTIRQPLVVSSGWTTTLFSATTISAETFYGGSLSASFVGNKNVNNQEFKYVSGLTSGAQTQINNLVNLTDPLITYQSDNILTNEVSLNVGTNMSSVITNTHFGVSASFPSLEVSAITVSLSQSSITDFNPTNWQVSDNIRSTHIILTGTQCSIISGLVAGTNGRIVVITNNSTGLIILENLSTKCLTENRFEFNNGRAYFLPTKRSLTLIYDFNQQLWIEYFPSSNETLYTLYNDYFTTLPYPYLFYPSVTAPIYQNNEFSVNGAISFSSLTTTNGTVVFCTSAIGRAFSVKYPSVTLSKIRINDVFGYTGFTNRSTSLFVCDNSDSRTNSINGRQAMFWSTPVTSVTYSDTTVWYNSYANSTFKPTSLKLSASTNDWVYLGMYNNTGNAGQHAFFYSLNGNEYIFSDLINTVTLVGSSGGLFGIGSYTNKTSVSPIITIDWSVLIIPGNK
jgi:hypothetical protein